MKNNLQEQLHRIKEMMSVISEEPMEFKPLNPKIKFNNGGSASIQASRTHYSEPRNNVGPYTSMEIGYPSEGTEIPDSLLKYEETSQHGKGEGFNPYDSIYAYVPVSVVKEFIEANGGIASGELPPMAEEDDINLTDMDNVEDEVEPEEPRSAWVLALPYNNGKNLHVYLFSTEESGKEYIENKNIKMFNGAYFSKQEIK